MYLADLDPFLRFASPLRYTLNAGTAAVTDCRLFYITDGSASLQISGETYSLIPGSLFYCCGGSRYAIRATAGFSLLVLDFDLDRTHADLTLPLPICRDPSKWAEIPIHFTPVEDSAFLGSHLFLAAAAAHRAQIDAIIAEFSSADPLGKIVSAAMLKALLLQLHRGIEKTQPSKVVLVRKYIEAHFSEPLTNRDLASLAGYHEYYLNRVFRAHTGVSLHEYLLQLRLRKARVLLLDPEIPLASVAEQCGFGSYPHFSGYFRQACGCSPGKYRQLHTSSI